jgi:hypothetical protein
MKKIGAGTLTNDDKRNGATTLPADPMGKRMAPLRFRASPIVRS